MRKLCAARIQPVKTPIISGHPQCLLAVYHYKVDKIVTQAVWIVRVVGKMGKVPGLGVKMVQTFTGSYPYTVVRGRGQPGDAAVDKTVGIEGIVPVHLKLFTVESV